MYILKDKPPPPYRVKADDIWGGGGDIKCEKRHKKEYVFNKNRKEKHKIEVNRVIQFTTDNNNGKNGTGTCRVNIDILQMEKDISLKEGFRADKLTHEGAGGHCSRRIMITNR